MSNLNNSPLLHTYKKIYCILLFTILSVFTLSAQQLPLQGNKKYTIKSLTVSGEQSFNEKTVIAFTGLKVGDRIFIPGEKLSEITKKLWEYIKGNKLQTKTENGKAENGGKYIVADAKLLPIFKKTKSTSKSGNLTDLTNLKEGETINMMQMAAVVGANIE